MDIGEGAVGQATNALGTRGSSKAHGLSIDIDVQCSGNLMAELNLDESISPGPQLDERFARGSGY